jgi:hypothetical protein
MMQKYPKKPKNMNKMRPNILGFYVKETWFSVIITDRRKSQETPTQHDLHINAPSAAAAEYQALCSYLILYNAAEQEHLIGNGLVTASVLTDVDEHGRVVPFDDKRYSGPVRVMILVCALLLGCALLWLTCVVASAGSSGAH